MSNDENEPIHSDNNIPPIEQQFLNALSSGQLSNTHIHLAGVGEKEGSNHIGWIFAVSGVMLAAVFGGVTLGTWYTDRSIAAEVERASINFNKDNQSRFSSIEKRTEDTESDLVAVNDKVSAIMEYINK